MGRYMKFPEKKVQDVTGAELKAALFDECPVIYNGITYQKIIALIYRKDGKCRRVRVSGELLDRSGNAVVIAPAAKITAI